MAHEIGVRLAEELWGERFQVLVATHLDKANHILTGTGAKYLAVLLYTILKKQSKSKGAVRLSSMLCSNKELKVFTVRQSDLKTFSKEARRYGVLYCALKGRRKSPDGLVDIMVRAEDAAKINRIVERYELAEVDKASIQNEIVDDRKDKTSRKPKKETSIQHGEKRQEPELTREESNRAEIFLDELMGKEKKKLLKKRREKRRGNGRDRQTPVCPNLSRRSKRIPKKHLRIMEKVGGVRSGRNWSRSASPEKRRKNGTKQRNLVMMWYKKS